MLRSMWRGLETWLGRNISVEAGAPVLDPTEDAALGCWQTLGPSGQARYTGAAIQTSLMLRAAFKLALRQIEGLMTSVLSLMGLTISGAGSHHGQPSRGDVAGHPGDDLNSAWSVACIYRQYRSASLRSRSVAGGQAWREVAPDVVQAASGD